MSEVLAEDNMIEIISEGFANAGYVCTYHDDNNPDDFWNYLQDKERCHCKYLVNITWCQDEVYVDKRISYTAHFCPKEHFDRWANSRHISFPIYREKSPEDEHGWTRYGILKHIKEKIVDSELLCDIIPGRMFDNFISVDML